MENNGNTGKTITGNVIWKFLERIAAELVTLIVSVILARIIAPEEYGAIALVTVFIAIANVFVTDGIPTALIQKKDADEIDFSSVFYFNILFSSVIYAAIYILAPSIASFYGNTVLCPVMRVMGLRIIIASVNSVQHSYVARKMMFRKYFMSSLLGTVISGVAGISMAYSGFGVWALAAQYMINTIIDTIVLFITVDWKPTAQFSFKRIVPLFNFGWKVLFENVIGTIMGQLQNMVIGKTYSSEELAYFTKAQQFPAVASGNIMAAINSVLFTVVSDRQDNIESVLAMLRKGIRISSYMIFPLLTCLAISAKSFISVILTDKWLPTTLYMQIFCFVHILLLGIILMDSAINGIGRSDVYIKSHMYGRIISVALLFATYRISGTAIVIGIAASDVILYLIVSFMSRKYINYTYADQISDVMPIIIGCIIMGIPVSLINYLNMPDIYTLILQVLLGSSIYIAYSVIRKLDEFYFLLGYVKDAVLKSGKLSGQR